MANPQVLFLGQDLYDLGYVIEIPDIDERKTFRRDKIGDNNFTLEVKNIDNFFSIGNSRSILTGIDWLYTSLQIINEDGITVWNGIVSDIRQDQRQKLAHIESNDVIFQFRDKVIEYESSDWETPASAAKNIMDTYDFTNYDSKSINDSINKLTNESCYVKCNFNLSSNITLINALENLGEKSCSDVFSHYGNIYFKHYQPFTGGVSLNLNISRNTRLKTMPLISSLEDQMINQFSIDYNGSSGIPATDDSSVGIGVVSRTKYGTKDLDSFNTGENQPIIFKDSTSAKYIGECFINRTHHNLTTQPQPIIKIQFDLDIKFKQYIGLETYFKLTLDDNGWDSKIFEVFEFRRNESQRNINIVAYEVNT